MKGDITMTMNTFAIKRQIDNNAEAIKCDHKKWINQTHFWNSIGHSNIVSITQYYSSKYKRQRRQVQDCNHYQPCRVFVDEELVIEIMMDTRTKAVLKFRDKLGINQHDPILTKEQ